MRILLVASETFPLAKVGGLADITSSLCAALQDLGHEPCLILPKYGSIRTPVRDVRGGSFSVSFMGHDQPVAVRLTAVKKGIPVFLVQNDAHFSTEEIYTRDELRRFLFFSLTIPVIISQLDLHPDIIHCHDWHTALVPLWLSKAKMNIPCIFTIHNLAYRGAFDQSFLSDSGLSSVWQEYTPVGAPRSSLNFMSRGILLADAVTTVSPTYASQVLTPQYGEGLEQLLNFRRNVFCGIVNGIDYDEYNPATDAYLTKKYDCTTVERRTDNKLALQRRSNLPQSLDVPLVGMVSRLEEQKGIDLLLEAAEQFIAETRAQLVILGQGREHYHHLLADVELKYPGRVSVTIANDEKLARLIYGSCDMFLMPSRFEPCGLGQMIAMRYGAVPVVRRTGGLADTVKDVTEENGNGFVFQEYTVSDMLGAMKRAVENFNHREEWKNLMRHNMNLDFSWRVSARKYEEIYLRARNMHQTREVVHK